MTMKTTTTTNLTSSNWWDSEDHKEWLELAKKDYHDTRPKGYWTCYYNSKNELIYEYVDM